MATTPDTPTETVTFQRWADPVIDQIGWDPAGDYSRICWLPILGPTSWCVLLTLHHQFLDPDTDTVTWNLDDLADAHGVGKRGNYPLIKRALTRLVQFGMLQTLDPNGLVRIRTKLTPLTYRQLARSSDAAQRFHHDASQARSGKAL